VTGLPPDPGKGVFASGSLAFEQRFESGIGVNCGRLILHKTTGIRCGAVIAVQIVSQHAKHGHQLSAMMGGVGDPPGHDPRARTLHREKIGSVFPPSLVLRFQLC
jgi:hypothetical protein